MPGAATDPTWWREAVVYQIYPRSFQDSDGDGDRRSSRRSRARLDHVAALGVDAIWLSPFYPSPFADCGYDVTDYTDVDPRFGTLDDFDALVDAAHARGLKVLLDLVPCHTSIEHPWFREHPDATSGPRARCRRTTGSRPSAGRPGRATSAPGAGTCTPSTPSSRTSTGAGPEVREAMADVCGSGCDRGADGFRIDAIDRLLKDAGLRDDPPAPAPAAASAARSSDARPPHSATRPTSGLPSRRCARPPATRSSSARSTCRPPASRPISSHLDAAFSFELLHAPLGRRAPCAPRIEAALEPPAGRRLGALQPRLRRACPTVVGPENARGRRSCCSRCRGSAFVYQGDEIGMADGPGRDPPLDRAGRDAHATRCSGTATARGRVHERRAVAAGRRRRRRGTSPRRSATAASTLASTASLIALRRELRRRARTSSTRPTACSRSVRGSDHLVALNLAAEPRPAPACRRAVARHRRRGASARPASSAPTAAPVEGFGRRARGDQLVSRHAVRVPATA